MRAQQDSIAASVHRKLAIDLLEIGQDAQGMEGNACKE
jgi:hypothetical protein